MSDAGRKTRAPNLVKTRNGSTSSKLAIIKLGLEEGSFGHIDFDLQRRVDLLRKKHKEMYKIMLSFMSYNTYHRLPSFFLVRLPSINEEEILVLQAMSI